MQPPSDASDVDQVIRYEVYKLNGALITDDQVAAIKQVMSHVPLHIILRAMQPKLTASLSAPKQR